MATPQIGCCTFQSYHDQMSPQPHVFRIVGQCEVPEGLTLTSTRHEPDDHASAAATFDLEVSGPEVPDDSPLVPQEVRSA